MLDRLHRWVAIAETCSDKRMASVVAEIRDAIAEIEENHVNTAEAAVRSDEHDLGVREVGPSSRD